MFYFQKDTKLPQYIPFPRFLLPLDIGLTAKVLYSLILSRTTLSAREENCDKWSDDMGHVYVFYTQEHMAEDLNRALSTVKTALQELEQYRLIERVRQGLGRPNRIYIIFPTNAYLVTDSRESVFQTGDYQLPDSRNSNRDSSRIPAPNNMNRTKDYSDLIIH